MRLEDIKSPQDIKGLSYAEMNDLAAQIRTELVTTISKRGGQLASNLGVVELTMAIHRVFFWRSVRFSEALRKRI